MKGFKFLTLVLFGLLAGQLWGQAVPPPSKPQVDKTEVERWGNRVVESGTGFQSAESMMFTAAMAPPEDDSDMWFISMYTMAKCPACEQLMKDFQNPNLPLASFVAVPPGAKRAWAHFNPYSYEDPFQKERLKNYGIIRTVNGKEVAGPFPCLVVQPPRNAKFGPPGIVVAQIWPNQYRSPKELHTLIVKTVEAYVTKLQQSGYKPPEFKTSFDNDGIPPANNAAFSQPPATPTQPPAEYKIGGPWGPDPGPTPNFNPQWPNGPNVQPTGPVPNVQPNSPSGSTLAQWALMLLAALKVYETVAPIFGWPTGFSTALKNILTNLGINPNVPNPAIQAAMNVPPAQSSTLPPPGYVMNSAGQLVLDESTPKPRRRT